MSEISPPVRPMMVHEIYPAPSSSELRAIYASEGESAEEANKAKEAYQAKESSSREASEDQYVEESGEVVAYEMKNGNMQTSTTFSAREPSMSWLA